MMYKTGQSIDTPVRRTMPKLLRKGFVLAVLAANLTACVPLVIGGAVGTGIVATDRRTTGAQLDDSGLELRSSRISEALQDRGRVSLTSYNRIVLMTGQVPSDADKKLAHETAKALPNIRTAVNELAVGPVVSRSQQFEDALISSSVKTALLGAKHVKSNVIKVITEDKVVYLMGIVTKEESDRAAAVASTVDGVRKVVKVFEIVDEAALNGGVPQSNAPISNAPVSTSTESSATTTP